MRGLSMSRGGGEPQAAEIAVVVDQALGEIHEILERKGTRETLTPRVSTQKRRINDLPCGAAPAPGPFALRGKLRHGAVAQDHLRWAHSVATASAGDYVRPMHYLSTRDAGPAPALRSFEE